MASAIGRNDCRLARSTATTLPPTHLEGRAADNVKRGTRQGVEAERSKHEPGRHCPVVVIPWNAVRLRGVLVLHEPSCPILSVMGAAAKHKQPGGENIGLVARPVANVRQEVAE
jgi:hypothetical protein